MLVLLSEYPTARPELLQLGNLLRQPQRAFGFFIDLVDALPAREEGDRR